jgi:predicted nucleic acid-binding protein
MTQNNRRVFLDTSVVFAAVLSPTGGARMLFRLGEAGVLKLLVGANGLRECDEVVRRKEPVSLPTLAMLMNIAQVKTMLAPTQKDMEFALSIVEYMPDARVLAEAISARPDWFITHDKEHFLKIGVDAGLNFRIGTPGDLIQALRDDFTLA